MTDDRQDDAQSGGAPRSLSPDVHPVSGDLASPPIQIAPPADWPDFTVPPVPKALGEPPLPDLEPISVPRRRPGPGFKGAVDPAGPRPSPAKRKRKSLWRRIL